MKYDITTLAERWDLVEKQDVICTEVWPEFMLHDPVADKYWGAFLNAFKEYQLLIMEGEEILAVANTVPLHFGRPLEELPDEGWDWGVARSVEDHRKGLKPDLLMGVQIVVNKRHQGKGLSSLAVREMAALGRRMGFQDLVIPVRPSNKDSFPLIPMEEYVNWKKEGDLPYDNWLRVHARCGGSILKVCGKAMLIPGTVEQWKSWTGLEFPGSGLYAVPGALSPVYADLEKDEVVYVEPNVWVRHRCGGQG